MGLKEIEEIQGKLKEIEGKLSKNPTRKIKHALNKQKKREKKRYEKELQYELDEMDKRQPWKGMIERGQENEKLHREYKRWELLNVLLPRYCIVGFYIIMFVGCLITFIMGLIHLGLPMWLSYLLMLVYMFVILYPAFDVIVERTLNFFT